LQEAPRARAGSLLQPSRQNLFEQMTQTDIRERRVFPKHCVTLSASTKQKARSQAGYVALLCPEPLVAVPPLLCRKKRSRGVTTGRHCGKYELTGIVRVDETDRPSPSISTAPFIAVLTPALDPQLPRVVLRCDVADRYRLSRRIQHLA